MNIEISKNDNFGCGSVRKHGSNREVKWNKKGVIRSIIVKTFNKTKEIYTRSGQKLQLDNIGFLCSSLKNLEKVDRTYLGFGKKEFERFIRLKELMKWMSLDQI